MPDQIQTLSTAVVLLGYLTVVGWGLLAYTAYKYQVLKKKYEATNLIGSAVEGLAAGAGTALLNGFLDTAASSSDADENETVPIENLTEDPDHDQGDDTQ